MSAASYFACLEGYWTFQRTVSNGTKVIGKALFQKKEANTLHYKEEGILTTAELAQLNCYKEYVYSLENEVINVFFQEKPLRFFHSLNFSDLNLENASGEHLCRLDHYKAFYFFQNKTRFIVQYTVNGPSKNYSITTLFNKYN